mmetsp:Transcript_7074/g.9179  ORF Transcript_7074/g.9179 Transcript_7074/m.9179 type:complete len:103 (-) Transcript_7074:254-562(-)
MSYPERYQMILKVTSMTPLTMTTNFCFNLLVIHQKIWTLLWGILVSQLVPLFFLNKKEDLATTPPIKRKGKSHLSHRELKTVTTKEIQQRIRTLLNNNSILK